MRPSSGVLPLPPTNRITCTKVEHVLGTVRGLLKDCFCSSSAVLYLMASRTISFAVGERCTNSCRCTCSIIMPVDNNGSRTCCSNLEKWIPRSLRSYSVHLTRLSNTYNGWNNCFTRILDSLQLSFYSGFKVPRITPFWPLINLSSSTWEPGFWDGTIGTISSNFPSKNSHWWI